MRFYNGAGPMGIFVSRKLISDAPTEVGETAMDMLPSFFQGKVIFDDIVDIGSQWTL